MTRIKQFSKSSVSYDPETGDFHWIVCYRKPWLNGELAGTKMSNFYIYIKADDKHHSASRLAWELMHGPIPQGLQIDHINRDQTDNRIVNLRIVTCKDNLANSRRNPGISGHLGISIYNRPTGNGFLWRTRKGGRVVYYQTLEEAIAGYAKLGSEACE